MKTIIQWWVALFLLNSLAIADELNPHNLLKEHYLSQFADTKKNSLSYKSRFGNEYSDKAYSLDERMTPLRVRTILLHYLCPECRGYKTEETSKSVRYHSDVWQDTQVFGVNQTPHIYSAAFPGMTVLGEFYGAYLLVTGATDDPGLIFERQRLIYEIYERELLNGYEKELEAIDEHLAAGLSILDRNHPIYALASINIMKPEESFSFYGEKLRVSKPDEEKHSFLEREIPGKTIENLLAQPAQEAVRGNYVSGAGSTFMGVMAYRMVNQLDPVKLQQWSGYWNYAQNGFTYAAHLGKYVNKAMIPVIAVQSLSTAYETHWNNKHINDSLTKELQALEAFLRALFTFANIGDLPTNDRSASKSGLSAPIINFSLSPYEKEVKEHLLSSLEKLRQTDTHFYHGNLYDAVRATRALLLLRETILRYLVNIARLDFYISVSETVNESPLWSYAQFDINPDDKTPLLKFRGLWNPALTEENAVGSDLDLGEKHPANIVLTGANASGKSTFLKAVGISNIFMAQTLGVAPAKYFKTRPFTHFVSLLDKKDKNGQSSSEAEKAALLKTFEMNKALSDQNRLLIIADEMLRTTKAKVGVKASEAFIKTLGTYQHVTLLVSTHYDGLKKIAVKYPTRFANKHMAVKVDKETGDVRTFLFRLADGPNPANNGMQLYNEDVQANSDGF